MMEPALIRRFGRLYPVLIVISGHKLILQFQYADVNIYPDLE